MNHSADATVRGLRVEGPGFVGLRLSNAFWSHATWNWKRRTAPRLEWDEAIRQVLEVDVSWVGTSAPQEMNRAKTAADEAEAWMTLDST